ncbi:MAG: 4Fe-4S binding protein [Syntrophobacteraceae bacterium]
MRYHLEVREGFCANCNTGAGGICRREDRIARNIKGWTIMCQFCHQHGEGKKWYLDARHYSGELLADMGRVRFLEDFVRKTARGRASMVEGKLRKAMSAPSWLRRMIFFFEERKYKRDHFGQVVPIEDVEKVLGLANSIVRVPCVCRKKSTRKTTNEFCFGLGLDPEKITGMKEAFMESFRAGPEVKLFEKLTPAEALDLHRSFEKKGLIHTVWTFKTPFIGGLCNCDRSDCLAMLSHRYDFRVFFRAEYVAETNTRACSGCRACISLCQFGAIGYSVLKKKAFIDPLRCHGCGVCRAACEFDAISLVSRSEHPLCRNLW